MVPGQRRTRATVLFFGLKSNQRRGSAYNFVHPHRAWHVTDAKQVPPLLREAVERFSELWQQAREREPWEADAMTLATATTAGRVSVRTVLLKRADAQGFVFYSNYKSRKGRELEENPQAALCFFWRTVRRQIIVQGSTKRLASAESDAYFETRNRLAQLGAWASEQSRPLDSRETLEARLTATEQKYAGQRVPRPPHWGGFLVVPESIEFWAPGEGRLNQRVRYWLDAETGDWRFGLLNP